MYKQAKYHINLYLPRLTSISYNIYSYIYMNAHTDARKIIAVCICIDRIRGFEVET